MRFKTATLSKAAILTVFILSRVSQPAIATGSTSTGVSSISSPGADWSTTRSVTIMDDANSMPAVTLQIPVGWGFAGGMMRPRGCHPPAVAFDGLSYTAVAPDRITAYEKLPGVSWGWASDGTNPGRPKCAPINIATASSFLLNIVIPNLRPDARNITVLPLTPQMQQGLEAQRRRLDAQPSAQNRRTIDTARVRLQYTFNNHPVEELLGTVLTCNEIDMPAYPLLHRAAVQRHFCQAQGINIRRALQGNLDAMIAKNLPPPQIDPAWDSFIQQRMQAQFAAWQEKNNAQFQAIQQHYRDVTGNMIKRSQQFQEQQRSSFENAMAQDRATQAAIDHAAQQQVRDSLNRADFIDPNTGRKIETSNQYSHNWISGDGTEVVLGQDPNFDPNGTIDPIRESWTELIPIN